MFNNLDSRGWIAAGCFLLVLAVLGIIVADKTLLESDAFLILATAIIITGWVQGPVGWAYQATKGGGELAERNAHLAERVVAEPHRVEIDQPPSRPIPTIEQPGGVAAPVQPADPADPADPDAATPAMD